MSFLEKEEKMGKKFLMSENNIGPIDTSNGSIEKEIKVILDNYDDYSFLETKSPNFTGVTNKSRRDNCKIQKKKSRCETTLR